MGSCGNCQIPSSHTYLVYTKHFSFSKLELEDIVHLRILTVFVIRDRIRRKLAEKKESGGNKNVVSSFTSLFQKHNSSRSRIKSCN